LNDDMNKNKKAQSEEKREHIGSQKREREQGAHIDDKNRTPRDHVVPFIV
jgi:ADP-ribose pyrophosphatase YjhB (NUDIX family)